MHATVTQLRSETHEQVDAAAAALHRIIDGLSATIGVRECYAFESAARELVPFTVYGSKAQADAASASMRPVIADAVGPFITATPSTIEGPCRSASAV